MSPFSFLRRHPRGELAPYVDARLDAAAAARVENHLARCATCSADVDAQREGKALVARLPVEQVPRSFALTPEMVATPARRSTPATPPLAAGLRIGAAGIALALAVVVFTDVRQEDGLSTSRDDAGSQSESLSGVDELAYDSRNSGDGAGSPEAPAATVAPPIEGGWTTAGGGVGGPNGGAVDSAATPQPAPTAPDATGETANQDQYAADNAVDSSADEASRATADGADNMLWLEALLLAALVVALAASVLIARAARR